MRRSRATLTRPCGRALGRRDEPSSRPLAEWRHMDYIFHFIFFCFSSSSFPFLPFPFFLFLFFLLFFSPVNSYCTELVLGELVSIERSGRIRAFIHGSVQ